MFCWTVHLIKYCSESRCTCWIFQKGRLQMISHVLLCALLEDLQLTHKNLSEAATAPSSSAFIGWLPKVGKLIAEGLGKQEESSPAYRESVWMLRIKWTRMVIILPLPWKRKKRRVHWFNETILCGPSCPTSKCCFQICSKLYHRWHTMCPSQIPL